MEQARRHSRCASLRTHRASVAAICRCVRLPMSTPVMVSSIEHFRRAALLAFHVGAALAVPIVTSPRAHSPVPPAQNKT